MDYSRLGTAGIVGGGLAVAVGVLLTAPVSIPAMIVIGAGVGLAVDSKTQQNEATVTDSAGNELGNDFSLLPESVIPADATLKKAENAFAVAVLAGAAVLVVYWWVKHSKHP